MKMFLPETAAAGVAGVEIRPVRRTLTKVQGDMVIALHLLIHQ